MHSAEQLQSFHILCLLFFVVIFITFFSQIVLKIVSDETMEDLVIKKDLLKYSQLRAIRAIQVQVNCRGAVLQISGALTQANMSGNGYGINETTIILNTYQKDLSNYNNHILTGIPSLDDDVRENLFYKDIRIFGSIVNSRSSESKNLTNFQVIEEIINTARTLASMSSPVSQKGWEAFNYLTINILNDFTDKNNEIINLFLYSVNQQREYFEKVIALCLAVTPTLLAGMGILLILIIWNQYRLEVNYMLAFVKLSPNEVKEIMVSLKNFKRSVNNEELFENKYLTEVIDNTEAFTQDIKYKIY